MIFGLDGPFVVGGGGEEERLGRLVEWARERRCGKVWFRVAFHGYGHNLHAAWFWESEDGE